MGGSLVSKRMRNTNLTISTLRSDSADGKAYYIFCSLRTNYSYNTQKKTTPDWTLYRQHSKEGNIWQGNSLDIRFGAILMDTTTLDKLYDRASRSLTGVETNSGPLKTARCLSSEMMLMSVYFPGFDVRFFQNSSLVHGRNTSSSGDGEAHAINKGAMLRCCGKSISMKTNDDDDKPNRQNATRRTEWE